MEILVKRANTTMDLEGSMVLHAHLKALGKVTNLDSKENKKSPTKTIQVKGESSSKVKPTLKRYPKILFSKQLDKGNKQSPT